MPHQQTVLSDEHAERLARDGANFQLHYCAHSGERAAFVDYLDRCAFADRVYCHFDHGDSSRRATCSARAG